MMKLATLCSFSLQCLLACSLPKEALAEGGQVLDAIVASVDGNPITLHDLGKKTGHSVSLKEVSQDVSVRTVVDGLINDHLIKAEAETRKVGVSDAEVDDYINEVAKRNSLAKSDFENALTKEGMTLAQYKEQIRIDILKTRIQALSLKGGVPVGDNDVDKFIESHPEEFSSGGSVHLRQIVLDGQKHSEEKALKVLDNIKRLVRDGEEEFKDAAKKISESPEAPEGGDLGNVMEKDLNPTIFDAILSLKEGETSKVIKTEKGYHVFFVEERKGGSQKVGDAQRLEVRKILEARAAEERSALLLNQELEKNHSIDRKF